MAKRVWDAIRELDYFPNTQARAWSRAEADSLASSFLEITNPFFPELIQDLRMLLLLMVTKSW